MGNPTEKFHIHKQEAIDDFYKVNNAEVFENGTREQAAKVLVDPIRNTSEYQKRSAEHQEDAQGANKKQMAGGGELNEMLVGEIRKFAEGMGEEVLSLIKWVGIELKLALGMPKHFEYFYKDFKDIYDRVQPLAEKLHMSMSGFKHEREMMKKKIFESSVSEEDKNEYQEAVKKAYDISEEYLIPIPYRLQKMEEVLRSLKTGNKATIDYTSRKNNWVGFQRAYDDILMAIAVYKDMTKVMENIKNKISITVDKVV